MKRVNISLPLSKSIALRDFTLRFILSYLNNSLREFKIIEECGWNEDIRHYCSALNKLAGFISRRVSDDSLSAANTVLKVNIGEGGAPCRFFMALSASIPSEGSIILYGSEKLSQRPQKPLVDTLNVLNPGGVITSDAFIAKIKGGVIEGGDVTVDVGISSQYLSALMMAAPLWRKGMKFDFPEDKKVVSMPYILMTVRLMSHYGFDVEMSGNSISVKPARGMNPFYSGDFISEVDWSAAAAIYEAYALFPEGKEIFIPGLSSPAESLQGDSRCAELFSKVGIRTEFLHDGALLRYDPTLDEGGDMIYDFDMCDVPDLVPSFAATLCFRGYPFRMRGISGLRFKESDRIMALTLELSKLGYILKSDEDSLGWNGERVARSKGEIVLDTHVDHRMAMALKPATSLFENVILDNPEVVGKSFPGYYEEYEKIIR